jgi:hypothetical protein
MLTEMSMAPLSKTITADQTNTKSCFPICL